MPITNAQWASVRPSGMRRKPRRSTLLQEQHGMATRQVIAKKQDEQRQAETAFSQEQSKKSLALQQQQAHEARKSTRRQQQIAGFGTGLTLLDTILGFF